MKVSEWHNVMSVMAMMVVVLIVVMVMVHQCSDEKFDDGVVNRADDNNDGYAGLQNTF